MHGACQARSRVHWAANLRGATHPRTKLGRVHAMSLALVQSRALLGLQAPAVTVEVHLANVGVKRNTVQLAKL